MLTKFKSLFVITLLVFSLCQNASAELAAVGPESPTNGFPSWHMDENGLALELCLTSANCTFDAPILGNIFSLQIGFGEKAFYWSANADLTGATGAAGSLKMALVASFSGSTSGPVPLDGEQITFFQIAVGPITGLTAGSVYSVTTPFGVLENLVADASGIISEQRQDIGCASQPCDFTAVLRTGIGPFLKWDPGVLPAPPAGFIGNPTVTHKVIGSPFGTNIFRIEGPNAGGSGIHFKQTDLFKVQGKIFTGTVPTPLIVDRSTYTRTIPGYVDVWATSAPMATVRVSGGPNLPSLPVTMLGDGNGKFFAHIRVPNATTLPTFVTVTASNPPNTTTTVQSALVDVVTITNAEFNAGTLTLTIEASSSDQHVPPTLTAIGFGNLIAGKIVVPGLAVPPTQVTVESSARGTDTAQVVVFGGPQASNDTGLTLINNPVVINVLSNDRGVTSPIDPATVAIIVGPANGTTLADPVTGAVTYSPNPGFVGNDSFTYTVQDNFGFVSNVATVNVRVVGGEVITVTTAVFRNLFKLWTISGTSSVAGPGNTVTLYVGPDTTGPVIGTASVGTNGVWKFSGRSVLPGTATTISVKSTLGTEVLAFPLIKRRF
jgi:Bacterial Ig domain